MTNWQCLFNNHVLDVTKWFMLISCLNQLCMGGSWAQLERPYHISEWRCCAWVYIKGVMISIFSVNKSLHTLFSYTYCVSFSRIKNDKSLWHGVLCDILHYWLIKNRVRAILSYDATTSPYHIAWPLFHAI